MEFEQCVITILKSAVEALQVVTDRNVIVMGAIRAR